MDIEITEILWKFITILSCLINFIVCILMLLRKLRIRKVLGYKKDTCKIRKRVLKVVIILLILSDGMYICGNWNQFHACIVFCNSYNIVKLLAHIFGISTLLLVWIEMEHDKKIIEEELREYELYSGAYEEVVEKIRMRQHEFENHLNAILCMGSTIHDYEKLIDAQKEYCKDMIQENKLNKIVGTKVEPVITGFLYTKISQAENCGIEVHCEVHSIDTKKLIKTHDLIEIIGILVDNAIDAIKEYDKQKIIIRLIKDSETGFLVEIANTSRIFNNTELEKFCEYGYSTKGSGRGLGLARLKMIVEKNNAEFFIENREIDERNYLVFKVLFKNDEK